MPSSAYPDHPRPAVGAIVVKDEKVLLVRRGQPPGQGFWSIPGGSVHLGETLQQAAEREIMEETGLVVEARDPVFVFDVVDRDEAGHIRFHYVIIDLVADYVSGELRAGDDAAEARWVSHPELNGLGVSAATRHVLETIVGFK